MKTFSAVQFFTASSTWVNFYTIGMRDRGPLLNMRDPDGYNNALAWINEHRSTRTRWHLYVGALHENVPAGRQRTLITVATRKPRAVAPAEGRDFYEVIGDRVFSGTWEESWETAEPFVRML